LRYSVRNAAATIRTDCCIQPVAHNSRMPVAAVAAGQQKKHSNNSSGVVVSADVFRCCG
jgi:hypothetical protein